MESNNRLIAEFMVFSNVGINNPLYAVIIDGKAIGYFGAESLLFDTSFDWLIPVIEKCRERQIFGSQRLISNIDKRLLTLDLLSTYQNVVEFIQWYNLNQVEPQLKEQTGTT